MSTSSLRALRAARAFQPFGSRARLVISSTASRRWISHTCVARDDPWLLPNTPEHVKASGERATENDGDIAQEDGIAYPRPIKREGESPETKRARLVYQSRKRGTREAELLLSTFAREHMPGMSEQDMADFDELMDEPDWDIYYWATEKKTPPARWQDSPVLHRLREHARNEGRVVRRMPEL